MIHSSVVIASVVTPGVGLALNDKPLLDYVQHDQQEKEEAERNERLVVSNV